MYMYMYIGVGVGVGGLRNPLEKTNPWVGGWAERVQALYLIDDEARCIVILSGEQLQDVEVTCPLVLPPSQESWSGWIMRCI
jgi:hypothetical protein